MKNSLFKRALAVAAAAPLALTQCLTVANAASINNADIAAVENETVTADKSITLNGEGGLAYIAPGKDDTDKDYYMVGETALADLELTEDSYTITKDSDWNETVYGILTSGEKSGSFSIQKGLQEAAKRTGNYQDVTNKIIKHVGDVNYNIDGNGNIELRCKVSDVVPELTSDSEKTIGDVLNDLAAKYGVEIADDKTFSDVVIKGEFVANIDGSSLKNNTKVTGTIQFIDEKAVPHRGTDIIDYALGKLDALESDANSAIDEAFDATQSEAIADCKAQVADSLAYYRKQLNRAKTWAEKIKNKTTEEKSFGTFGEALQAVKDSSYGQKVENKFNKDIPTSGAAIAANETVSDLYGKAVDKLKAKGYDVQISAEELGAFADGFYDITAQLLGGSATFSAKFTDAEKDDVAAYILEEYGLEVIKDYKTVDVTADYSKMDLGQGSVDVKVKRVIEAVTTTTTTSTTTSTETTTTTTSTETETETTTTSTDTDTTTTTTTTTDEGSGTSTTTTKVVKMAANYYVTSKTGFYLNIDEKFNKEQIESVYVSYDETEISYGEAMVNGQREIVDEKVLTKGKGVNVTDKVGFGSQTPANVFVKGDYKFSHEIALYATEDIIVQDFEGKDVIATASGAALTSADGISAITIAYVGVKGDGDLNYMADAKDASLVLVWYAKMSTMDDPEARAAEVFSNSDQITELDENGERVIREEYDKNLDQFAAFLCDVDNENADDNWYALKKTRKIDAKDASFIKVMYSWASTGTTPDRTTWNEVLGDFAKKAKTEE